MENFYRISEKEMTEHRLSSFNEGIHKLPVEEDPRMKYALEEQLALLKQKLN